MSVSYVALSPCHSKMQRYIDELWTANDTSLEYTKSYKEAAVLLFSIEAETKKTYRCLCL